MLDIQTTFKRLVPLVPKVGSIKIQVTCNNFVCFSNYYSNQLGQSIKQNISCCVTYLIKKVNTHSKKFI
jgi:hypothetical protein